MESDITEICNICCSDDDYRSDIVSDCSDCSEDNDGKEKYLYSPNNECKHKLCKNCWSKIVICGNGLCPYCREDVKKWAYITFGVKHFEDKDENDLFNEKLRYVNYLFRKNVFSIILVLDAKTGTKSLYFYSEEDQEINKENLIKNLFKDKRIRHQCNSVIVINEFYSNLSFAKIKCITNLSSKIDKNGTYHCICGVSFDKNNIDIHLRMSKRHELAIKYLIDKNFEKYCQWFDNVNLEED